MRTTLMIECDIKHAPEILLAAQKIIDRAKQEREDWQRKQRTLAYPTLSALEWYELNVEDKTNYICRDGEGNEFDIGIFDRAKEGMCCELCDDDKQVEIPYVIGTTDTREPKFCFQHYGSINENSRFIRKGISDHAKIC